ASLVQFFSAVLVSVTPASATSAALTIATATAAPRVIAVPLTAAIAARRQRADRGLARQEAHLAAVGIVALHLQELRRHARPPHHCHLHLSLLFPGEDLATLFVEQVRGHFWMDRGRQLPDVLAIRGQLQEPHDLDRHTLSGLHGAIAAAVS